MLCHYCECCYAECRIIFIVMLNVVILNVVMLSVVVERTAAVTVMGIFRAVLWEFSLAFCGHFLQLMLMILESQVTNTVAFC
jgi:hypothetical protein